MQELATPLSLHILGKAGRHATHRCASASRMFAQMVADEKIVFEFMCCEENDPFCLTTVCWAGDHDFNSVRMAMAGFEQFRDTNDGMLHPAQLPAAVSMALRMEQRGANAQVCCWQKRDGWEPVPLSLTGFVSLCHGSYPLSEELVHLHQCRFNSIVRPLMSLGEAQDCPSDATVPAKAFLKQQMWVNAACDGMLPSFRSQGGRTNLNTEGLPFSLQVRIVLGPLPLPSLPDPGLSLSQSTS